MKTDENQNIILAEIKKDIESLVVKLEECCSSHDAYVKKEMCDRNHQSYSTDIVKIEKMTDRLFKEQTKINLRLSELKPAQKFYNKIRDFAVGSIIVLGGAVIAMASYIYDKLN